MSTKFRFTFDVDKSLVGVITPLIIDRVSAFSVTELGGEPKKEPRRAYNPHVTAPVKDTRWCQPAAQDILAAMRKSPDKEFYYKDLAKYLLPHGIGGNSISPVISSMTRAGQIVRTRVGHYKVAG